ncbi:hypothetical protein KNE206_52040 [Kitasatospora sp. NE20-6]
MGTGVFANGSTAFMSRRYPPPSTARRAACVTPAVVLRACFGGAAGVLRQVAGVLRQRMRTGPVRRAGPRGAGAPGRSCPSILDMAGTWEGRRTGPVPGRADDGTAVGARQPAGTRRPAGTQRPWMPTP